jgi:hypothetical protein
MQKNTLKPIGKIKIKFRTKFDIVELDANGHAVDKGDDDFAPSKKWIGRKAGFEIQAWGTWPRIFPYGEESRRAFEYGILKPFGA